MAQILIPFVDATGDNATPFSFEPVSLQDQLVPVLAGTLQQQTSIQLANFNPPHDAFKTVDQGQFEMDINQGLPQQANILGAPIPNLPTFTGIWNVINNQTINEQFYRGVLSSPYIHTYSGRCSKTTFDWDEKFLEPFYVQGDFQSESARGLQCEIFDGLMAKRYCSQPTHLSLPLTLILETHKDSTWLLDGIMSLVLERSARSTKTLLLASSTSKRVARVYACFVDSCSKRPYSFCEISLLTARGLFFNFVLTFSCCPRLSLCNPWMNPFTGTSTLEFTGDAHPTRGVNGINSPALLNEMRPHGLSLALIVSYFPRSFQ